MNAVNINRLELLDIVKKNRELHIAEFQEAIVGYKEKVVEVAKNNLRLAKTGDLAKIAAGTRSLPTAPISYENEYTKAIRMLEMSVDEIISVEEDVFNQIVLDEWSWKRSFMAATAMYKSA